MNTKIDLSIGDKKLYLWGIRNEKSDSINTQLLSFIIIETYKQLNSVRKTHKRVGENHMYVEDLKELELVNKIKGFDGVLYELVFVIIYYTRVWINSELGIKRNTVKDIPMEQWIGKYIDEIIDKKEISCRIYDYHLSDKYDSRYIFNIKELNDLFIGLYEEFEKVSIKLNYYEKEIIRIQLQEKAYSIYISHVGIDYFNSYSEIFILSDTISLSNENASINDIDDEIDFYLPTKMIVVFRNLKIEINNKLGKLDIKNEEALLKKIRSSELGRKIPEMFFQESCGLC